MPYLPHLSYYVCIWEQTCLCEHVWMSVCIDGYICVYICISLCVNIHKWIWQTELVELTTNSHNQDSKRNLQRKSKYYSKTLMHVQVGLSGKVCEKIITSRLIITWICVFLFIEFLMYIYIYLSLRTVYWLISSVIWNIFNRVFSAH